MNCNNQLDFTRIVSKVYQGSGPVPGAKLRDAGFGALVLCATEWQWHGHWFDVPVIHAPFDDDGTLTPRMWDIASDAADKVVSLASQGVRVLTTCLAGRNRSGFVNALALIRLHGWSGRRATEWVKSRRNLALTNKAFCEALSKIKGVEHECHY